MVQRLRYRCTNRGKTIFPLFLTSGIYHPTEKPHLICRFSVLNLLWTPRHHLYIRISADFPSVREHLTWKQSTLQSKCPHKEAQLLLFNLPPPTDIFSAKCWENSRLNHLRLRFFSHLLGFAESALSLKIVMQETNSGKKNCIMKIIWRESLTLMKKQSLTKITLRLNVPSQFLNKTGSV